MGKRELIALLNLSSWCLVMVERLFLAVLRGCLQFVIVVFPDHTHLLFLIYYIKMYVIVVSLAILSLSGHAVAQLEVSLALVSFESWTIFFFVTIVC